MALITNIRVWYHTHFTDFMSSQNLNCLRYKTYKFTTIPYDKNCEHLEDAKSKGGLPLDLKLRHIALR